MRDAGITVTEAEVISTQARDELGALVDFPIRPATITIHARPQAVLANHLTTYVFPFA